MSSVEATSKKRKVRVEDAIQEPNMKKTKRDKKSKSKVKSDKGKEKAPPLAQEFTLVHASMVISLPPIFASNPLKGVEEMLDSMIMRYIPSLRGVVLTHSNVNFLHPTATLQGDSPFAVCHVAFDAMIWNPQLGMRLSGKVTLCSPDHVALLVHSTFNVSIPRHHIPTDSYQFEHGPAENDPEFGPAAQESEGNNIDEESRTHSQVQTSGRWIHRMYGEELGGKDGILEFTVVGMTIANQMLSLIGSIQPDPFNPEHVAKPAEFPAQPTIREEEDEIESQLGDHLAEDTENEEDDTAKQKTALVVPTVGSTTNQSEHEEGISEPELEDSPSKEVRAKKVKKRKRKEEEMGIPDDKMAKKKNKNKDS